MEELSRLFNSRWKEQGRMAKETIAMIRADSTRTIAVAIFNQSKCSSGRRITRAFRAWFASLLHLFLRARSLLSFHLAEMDEPRALSRELRSALCAGLYRSDCWWVESIWCTDISKGWWEGRHHADAVRLTGEALTSGACKPVAVSNFGVSWRSRSLDYLWQRW